MTKKIETSTATAISISRRVHERVKRYCSERGLKMRIFVDSALLNALHDASDKQKRLQKINGGNAHENEKT